MNKFIPIFLAVLAILVLAGALVSVFAGSKTDSLTAYTKSCTKTGKKLMVSIKSNMVQPRHTDAQRCDILTIANEDSQIRLIAFGAHDHHVAYNGFTEKTLDKNQSFSILLNQVGTYKFHDHLSDTAQGTFTVR